MSKAQKLIEKFLKQGNDFVYDDLVAMLNYFGYEEAKIGKTTGSAVCFVNKNWVRKFDFTNRIPNIISRNI